MKSILTFEAGRELETLLATSVLVCDAIFVRGRHQIEAEFLERVAENPESMHLLDRRALQYVEARDRVQGSIDLLKDAGIVVEYAGDESQAAVGSGSQLATDGGGTQFITRVPSMLWKTLPPTFFDVFGAQLLAGRFEDPSREPTIRLDKSYPRSDSEYPLLTADQLQLGMNRIFQVVDTVEAAERLGAIPTYASESVMRVFAYAQSDESNIEHQVDAPLDRLASQVGRALIARQFPRVDDLPLEVVVDITQRRKPEMQAFRVGLAQIAAEIEGVVDSAELELEMTRAFAKHVDPALVELESAIYSSRLDALAKLSKPKGLASLTVPAVLSAAAGAPVGVSVAAGVAAAALEPAIDASVNKRKIVRASQWGLLYRLKQR